MNLILFSGNSLRNKEYIYTVEKELKPFVSETYVQEYGHWDTGAKNIDLPQELEVLKQQIPNLGNYGVFAKSRGMVLAVMAIEQGIIEPEFILFCGIPLGFILEEYPKFASVLGTKNIPLTVIHNDQDAVGSSAAVKEYLHKNMENKANYKYIETKGTTHDYEDYKLVKSELKELLNPKPY